MTEVSIQYNLGQHGWSSLKLIAGDKAIDIGEFGSATDALGDLIRAALHIASNALRAEVSFDGEPGEWRLLLEREWPLGSESGWVENPLAGTLHLRVFAFRDFAAGSPAADGQLIFEAYVAPDTFANAVRTTAQSIWDAYGARGYDQAWNGHNGFPLRALRALDAALAHREPVAAGRFRTHWEEETSAIA